MKTHRPKYLKKDHYLRNILTFLLTTAAVLFLVIMYAEKNEGGEILPIPAVTTLAAPVTPETEPVTQPATEPEVTVPEPLYSPEELEMLACVIYQEAGADACCDDCRRRVADVVLNRVADERFPNSIYDVLTQERQYGRFHWTGIVWPERADNPGETHAVTRAYRIAREVLEGEHSELYGRGYIWQAEFKQGSGTLECCNIYFGK